jgi:predicted ATPase
VRALPTGTVTFLFSDIEGSTRLLDELGAKGYAEALAEHRRVMREAFAAHGGVEVDMQGDAFFVAFPDARGALSAAGKAQHALAAEPVRVRMGLHTGEPLVTDEGYVGIDVHRGARVMSAGHGGQVLVSEATYAQLDRANGLVDLGLHRLKDLTEPQRLWQLGEGEFPPLKTLYQTNLPVQPTPLVGREEELDRVVELLEGSRLLTLTGAGGSGKTRLALQAAAELVDEFKDGVWWVALSALRDPGLVEPTIAHVVGATDGLREHLRGKQTLLLLDNFEQLLEAAPQISTLLAEAPDVRVLATSRERLAVAAEQEYAVPTMPSTEAVALFTARARQLDPDFEPDDTVAEICRRLDGLPLAVELAAARVKALTAVQILELLGGSLDLLTAGARDAPDRQKTLRATMEWSYDLLDENESALFGRIGVFAGSFDLKAFTAVCGGDVDALAALVDKSLLRRTAEGRFFMLETIREYAAERLDETTEAEELRRRHAEVFVGLAEQADAGLKSAEQGAWLDRLEAEIDNFRSALRWSLEGAEPEAGFRLCSALMGFWFKRDHLLEAAGWLDLAVSRLSEAPPSAQGRVLQAAGSAALLSNEFDRARPLAERAVTAAREAGDRLTEALAIEDLGAIARGENDIERAITLTEQALAMLRDLGATYWTASALHLLAEYRRDVGEYDRARGLFEEAIGLWLADGCSLDAAYTIHSLGDLALDTGDLADAEKRYLESLELLKQSGAGAAVSSCLAGLSAVAAANDASERAARLWGAVEGVERSIGMSMVAFERARYEPRVQNACEREPAALAEGRKLDLASAITYAFATR